MNFIRLHYFMVLIFCLLPILLHGMKSSLELFPEKGKEEVVLPFVYYSPTDVEKQHGKFVQENEFVILNENSCALVGPLQPCQLVLLTNKDKEPIVGHISAQGNLNNLLQYAKKHFGDNNLSQTYGNIFTNKTFHYEQIAIKNKNWSLTWCELYQKRSQIEELKYNKDCIIAAFGIKNRAQIIANIFTSKKKDLELGNYEFAELYVIVRYINQQCIINSICPMAENIFGNFQHLPLGERLQAVGTEQARLSKAKAFCYYGEMLFEQI